MIIEFKFEKLFTLNIGATGFFIEDNIVYYRYEPIHHPNITIIYNNNKLIRSVDQKHRFDILKSHCKNCFEGEVSKDNRFLKRSCEDGYILIILDNEDITIEQIDTYIEALESIHYKGDIGG